MMRIAFLTILLAVCLSPLASSLQPKSRLVRTSAAVTVNVKKASPLLFAGAAMSDKGEEWTKPRLHNTATFRSLAILGALTAAGVSSKSPLAMLSVQTKAALHLFSYATWFGTMVYTTFVLGITMFKNLPRTTFGKLQAKLFPKYFALSSIAIVLQLITLKGLTSASSTAAKSTKALIAALVMTLLNQFVLEPIATNNMMRRYELDDTPSGHESDEYKKLKANFGKFHGISSLTNLVALCAAAAHGFFLSAAFV